MRPGNGWKHVGGSVFERNGYRVHGLDMCRLPDGSFVSGNSWPECKNLDLAIRINGGNRKRGLMAWANGLAA